MIDNELRTQINAPEKGSSGSNQVDNRLAEFDPENLIGLYFREAASLPLLTFDEEVEIAKRIERGLLAREEMGHTANKTSKRYQDLRCMIDDSQSAMEHLITANSRLVISIAKRYRYRGLPLLDLIQEGNIGLIRAAKKFDYKRGFKFSTYATWWIRQAVTRAVADQSRTIRMPVHINDQLVRLFRAQDQLKQDFGRDPEIIELADEIGVSPEKVQEMFKISQFPLSLDMPTSTDDESVLGDFIADDESLDPDQLATDNLMHEHLDHMLDLLPAREAQILKLRFGLTGGKSHTLREVGIKIGVSRERVRQIEYQALRRLRQPEIQRELRSYLEQPII